MHTIPIAVSNYSDYSESSIQHEQCERHDAEHSQDIIKLKARRQNKIQTCSNMLKRNRSRYQLKNYTTTWKTVWSTSNIFFNAYRFVLTKLHAFLCKIIKIVCWCIVLIITMLVSSKIHSHVKHNIKYAFLTGSCSVYLRYWWY
jgi:hypothetical protein